MIGHDMRRSRFILTVLLLIFICSCTVPLESTKASPEDPAVKSEDLAKDPVNKPAAADSKDSKAMSSTSVITAIEVANEFVNITASKPFTYKVLDTSDPYKKVIECSDVSPGRFEDIILPGSTKVADIRVKSVGPKNTGAVVVLTLASIVEIKDKYAESTLTLVFNKPAADGSAETSAPQTSPQQKNGHLPAGKNITGIDLVKDPERGTGVEIIGDGQLTPDVSTLNGRVIVDFKGLKMLAVAPNDITPPISSIRAGQHKDKVRIVIDLSDKAVYKVDQHSDKVIVFVAQADSVRKTKTAASETSNEDKPSHPESIDETEASRKEGLITMDYNNVDIMAALKLIAYVSSYNIVVDPRVSGKTTIHAKDMPWDKALDLIVESNKLKKLIEGNVIKIAPAQEAHTPVAVKQSPLSISDLTITFSDAGGAMKTIKRANVALSGGSMCVDLTSADIQPAVISPNTHPLRPTPAQRPAIAHKKPAQAKNSHKKKGKKR